MKVYDVKDNRNVFRYACLIPNKRAKMKKVRFSIFLGQFLGKKNGL